MLHLCEFFFSNSYIKCFVCFLLNTQLSCVYHNSTNPFGLTASILALSTKGEMHANIYLFFSPRHGWRQSLSLGKLLKICGVCLSLSFIILMSVSVCMYVVNGAVYKLKMQEQTLGHFVKINGVQPHKVTHTVLVKINQTESLVCDFECCFMLLSLCYWFVAVMQPSCVNSHIPSTPPPPTSIIQLMGRLGATFQFSSVFPKRTGS